MNKYTFLYVAVKLRVRAQTRLSLRAEVSNTFARFWQKEIQRAEKL